MARQPLSNVSGAHPNPYLRIGVNPDTIGLPLSKVDAQKIIDASHQAPFGRGTETLVDKAVRNTWELSRGHSLSAKRGMSMLTV